MIDGHSLQEQDRTGKSACFDTVQAYKEKYFLIRIQRLVEKQAKRFYKRTDRG